MSYQLIVIAGNLGREPEMRYTGDGKAVTNFSVATTRAYPGADGQMKKETIWFRVTAWGKMAENCNTYLHKGSKVLVEGRLNADPATGGPKIYSRQDGSAGANFEITASDVKFLSSKNDGNGNSGAGDHDESYPPASSTSDGDDIPF